MSQSVLADDDVAKAREHFRTGTRAYDLGRYLEAAKEYERAYEAKDDPALLFNIAQAYRLGGDYTNGLRAYKSYLRRVPAAPNRAEVEAKIAELHKTIEQQQRAKDGPPDGLQSGQILSAPRAPVTAPPPQSAPAALELKVETRPLATDTPKPIYKRWWLWTGIGAVAGVGLAVGLGVGLAPGPSAPEAKTDGGTFKPFGG